MLPFMFPPCLHPNKDDIKQTENQLFIIIRSLLGVCYQRVYSMQSPCL